MASKKIKKLKKRIKFLKKMNKELQHRLDAIAINAMAKEMTGCTQGVSG